MVKIYQNGYIVARPTVYTFYFRPIIVTRNLLEWMGYKGLSNKQEKFSRLLDSLKIEYICKHPLALEYSCVQKEVKLIPKQLDQKRWICMEPRPFKKVIMRLNTKNAEMVRDYYLNLEEAMFAYGEYTMNYLIDKTEQERSHMVEERSHMVEERSHMVEELESQELVSRLST
jgi:hypothetical protein